MNDIAEKETETTGTLARMSGVLPETIRMYADMGLIECTRTAAGVRMFRASVARQVRKLRRERLLRRGGNHKPKATASA